MLTRRLFVAASAAAAASLSACARPAQGGAALDPPGELGALY